MKGLSCMNFDRIFFRYIVAVIGAASISLSCSRSTTGPDHTFSLKLSVKDTHGNPVPGLRVSMINDITPSVGMTKRIPGNPARPQAVTTIGFDAPVVFRGSLSVVSMRGIPLADLIDGAPRRQGSYQVNWTTPAQLPSGVYQCRFVATDSSGGSVLFRDSMFVSLYQVDPASCVIGWTNVSGILETGDPSLFPSLLQLPPLRMTDASGPSVIGTFTYADSVTITLSDTLNHLGMVGRGVVRQGQNAIDILWMPTAMSGASGYITQQKSSLPDSSVTPDSSVVPTQWKLRQNYPNPFN